MVVPYPDDLNVRSVLVQVMGFQFARLGYSWKGKQYPFQLHHEEPAQMSPIARAWAAVGPSVLSWTRGIQVSSSHGDWLSRYSVPRDGLFDNGKIHSCSWSTGHSESFTQRGPEIYLWTFSWKFPPWWSANRMVT